MTWCVCVCLWGELVSNVVCVCGVCELLDVMFGSKQWQSSPSLAAGCCEDLDSSILSPESPPLGTEALFYLDGNLQSLINYTLITQARLSGESVKNILFSLDITLTSLRLAKKYIISFSGLSQYAAMFLTIIIRTTYKTPALPPLLNATVYLCVGEAAVCRDAESAAWGMSAVTPWPAHSCCAAHWAGAGRGLTYWERGVLAL